MPGHCWRSRPVRKASEVERLERVELGAFRFVRDAFVLDGDLIAADDNSHGRILPQVVSLARGIDRVEEQFEAVRHDEADDGSLRNARGGH